MFGVYAVPKSAKEALSNVFAKYGIELADEDQIDKIIEDCEAAVRNFEQPDESVKGIPGETATVLREIVNLFPEVRTVLDKVERTVKGALDTAEEDAVEVTEIEPGDGSEEEEVTEEVVEEVVEEEATEEAEEGGEEEEDEERGIEWGDDERQALLKTARDRLKAISMDPDLSDEEKEAEAKRIRTKLQENNVLEFAAA